MIKKLLFTVATFLVLSSCENQIENLTPETNPKEEMTFILETNELIETRSHSNGSSIDQLSYAIYNASNGNQVVELTTMDNVDFTNGSIRITASLVKGIEYTAIFWAQSSLCDAYEISEDMKLTIDYKAIANNNEQSDAFFAKETFKMDATNNSTKAQKILLTRPLAQINVLTPLTDWEHAVAQNKKIIQSGATIKSVGTSWNLMTDEIPESSLTDVTFECANIPSSNMMVDLDNNGTKEEYKQLSMFYVIAPMEQTKHEVTFQLKDENNVTMERGPIGNIPVKRNNRTNIVCRLNTSNAEYSIYYSSIEDALQAIGNNSIEENANQNHLNSEVAIYIKDHIPHVVLLKDLTIAEKLTVSKDTYIELNGKQLTSTSNTVIEMQAGNLYIDGLIAGSGIQKYAQNEESSATLIHITGGNCTINGGTYYNSTHGLGTKNSPNANIVVGTGSNLIINDATMKAFDDNGGAVSAILVEENATLVGKNCIIEADSKTGLDAVALYSYGNVTLTTCNITGKADHTANATGKDYGTTSRGIYAKGGSLTVNDCYVYGMHAGMTVQCDLTVNGGTYDGYSHGGIYFAGTNKTAKIFNAQLRDAKLLEGYIDDGVAGTNNAGLYIGGATNMKVYMDNCYIYGKAQPIVMKANAATSYLYISNSTINLDYTHRGIRNDSSNYVYFGKGNNFGADDLEYKRNYEETSEEYNSDYQPVP